MAESKKEKIINSIKDGTDFPIYLLEYLEICFGVSHKYYGKADWIGIVSAFYLCISISPQVKLPITSSTGEKSKDDNWDYPERIWYLYSHLLAKEYGWEIEYISRLSVFDALAYIQEILTDDQLEREFQHSLSEIAYPYDKSTKKSKFTPLPRPHWMRPKIKEVKKVRMPRVDLPIGVVDYAAIPQELRPKDLIN